MRVLLISANTETINMPTLPLGLAMVAAATRAAGHETRYLDLLAAPDAAAAIGRTIREFSPEVVGISVRNVDDQNMADPRFLLEGVRGVVAACRAASRAPVVVGGAGYSIFPAAALRYLNADLGICGEGEVAFPALLEGLEQGDEVGDLPGVYVRERQSASSPRLVDHLDALPLPEEELWSRADRQDPNVWVPVQTRRGCALACSYCSTPHLEGRRLRARSPAMVAQHVARIAAAGFRRVYFVDNTFNLPPSYALSLCRCLQGLPLRVQWRAILYPHAVSEELVRAMADAGCVEVSLGFESGNLNVLRAMKKRFEPDEVRQIAALLAAAGIRRLGFLLLGGPGETEESVQESLAFAESLHLEMLKITAGIRLYPRTALAQMAIEQGMVAADDDLLRPRFFVQPGLEACLQRVPACGTAIPGSGGASTRVP